MNTKNLIIGLSVAWAAAGAGFGCATHQSPDESVRSYDPPAQVRITPIAAEEPTAEAPDAKKDRECRVISASAVTAASIEGGIRMQFSTDGPANRVNDLRRVVHGMADRHNRYHLDPEAKNALYDYLKEGSHAEAALSGAQPLTAIKSVASVENTADGAALVIWALRGDEALSLQLSAEEPLHLLRTRSIGACGTTTETVVSVDNPTARR